MSDYREPSHGEEYGPCAVCGTTALPKFGYFLCPRHGRLEVALRLDKE